MYIEEVPVGGGPPIEVVDQRAEIRGHLQDYNEGTPCAIADGGSTEGGEGEGGEGSESGEGAGASEDGSSASCACASAPQDQPLGLGLALLSLVGLGFVRRRDGQG